jgi:SAM-dependent methyltransferase
VSEVTTGIRAVLARPLVYELWIRAVGGVRARRTLVRDHVRPRDGDRILDVGCGPGSLVEYLPPAVDYVGVDLNPDYIASARARLGNDRRDFRVGDAAGLDSDLRDFDIVMVFGLLHHLDDAAARNLIRRAADTLVPGGRIVTFDGVFTADQSAASRAVIARDRGQNVRTLEEYVALAAESFTEVVATTRSDLLRIPYTHCILEGRAEVGRPPKGQ